jgi:hypothetical protein
VALEDLSEKLKTAKTQAAKERIEQSIQEHKLLNFLFFKIVTKSFSHMKYIIFLFLKTFFEASRRIERK